VHHVAGIPFVVEPARSLAPVDVEWLAGLRVGDRAAGPGPFRLELVQESWRPAGRISPVAPVGEPARLEWSEASDSLLVAHELFLAEIAPFERRGRLWRSRTGGPGLRATLRVAASALLPIEGGLPLHAAGIVIDGEAFAFFGPSGAGKTTLSHTAEDPLLSDESLAITPARGRSDEFQTPPDASGTSAVSRTAMPLGALVALDKGPGARLEALDRSTALRALIGATLVPAGPPLWAAGLEVLGRLVRDVPVLRMTWSPSHSRWAELRDDLLRLCPASTGSEHAWGIAGLP